VFIKYEAEVSSRVGGGERGVVDFGMLFTETNEQKFSFSADKLDLLLFATRPVVENMHSSTKISSRYSLRPIEMLRNSAADTFYGGFTASKIRRLIRRAVFFSGGF